MPKKCKIPDHLSEEMKKFYKSLQSEFDFETHHLVILTRACLCLDRADQAREEVKKDGLTVTDRYGSKKAHPAVKIEIDCKNTARLLLRELGLDLESSSEARGPKLYK